MSRQSAQFLGGALLSLASSVLALHGCSFSTSSGASSESSSTLVSSPFTSSSASFAGSEKEYQDEVSGYTNAYVRSSTADYAGYRKGLAEIAEKHGITNWEAQPITYNAIGRGLKKAGLKGVEYETFKENLGAGELTKMQDIEKGYNSRE
ncbi:MAG: putative lipoprotein [Methylococcales bacterium]